LDGQGYTVRLPIGYTDSSGTVHRDATLRKMTGREEALMADPRLRKNGGRLVTMLLANCIAGLGTLPKIDADVTARLYSVDRNYLLMELRKVTFGDTLDASYTCPGCGKTTEVTEYLNDLPVKRLADVTGPVEVAVQLEDGFEYEGQVHKSMLLTLPSGIDEEKIAAAGGENPSRAKNAMLARCIRALGSLEKGEIDALGTHILMELTLGDRRRIDKAIEESTPGLDLTREVTCDHCGRTFKSTLDMTNFFPSADQP
jgi:transcription elongation factor Elf1